MVKGMTWVTGCGEVIWARVTRLGNLLFTKRPASFAPRFSEQATVHSQSKNKDGEPLAEGTILKANS